MDEGVPLNGRCQGRARGLRTRPPWAMEFGSEALALNAAHDRHRAGGQVISKEVEYKIPCLFAREVQTDFLPPIRSPKSPGASEASIHAILSMGVSNTSFGEATKTSRSAVMDRTPVMRSSWRPRTTGCPSVSTLSPDNPATFEGREPPNQGPTNVHIHSIFHRSDLGSQTSLAATIRLESGQSSARRGAWAVAWDLDRQPMVASYWRHADRAPSEARALGLRRQQPSRLGFGETRGARGPSDRSCAGSQFPPRRP